MTKKEENICWSCGEVMRVIEHGSNVARLCRTKGCSQYSNAKDEVIYKSLTVMDAKKELAGIVRKEIAPLKNELDRMIAIMEKPIKIFRSPGDDFEIEKLYANPSKYAEIKPVVVAEPKPHNLSDLSFEQIDEIIDETTKNIKPQNTSVSEPVGMDAIQNEPTSYMDHIKTETEEPKPKPKKERKKRGPNKKKVEEKKVEPAPEPTAPPKTVSIDDSVTSSPIQKIDGEICCPACGHHPITKAEEKVIKFMIKTGKSTSLLPKCSECGVKVQFFEDEGQLRYAVVEGE